MPDFPFRRGRDERRLHQLAAGANPDEPAFLTGFRDESGEAQVTAGLVVIWATTSWLRYVEEHELRQARRDAAIRRPQ